MRRHFRLILLRLSAVAFIVAAGIGCSIVTWDPPPNGAALAGPYPTNYKQRIAAQLEDVLFDIDSAKFKWGPPPALMWGWVNSGIVGRRDYGWGVCLRINAKNRFGAYVGYTPYFALFAGDDLVVGAASDSWRPRQGCYWMTSEYG